MATLRMEARRLVKAMARMLGMKRPRSDIYRAGSGEGGDLPDNAEPFWGNDSPVW